MSVLHHDIIRALRASGSDGLSEGDMAKAGGRWWERHVRDINRWKLAVIGWEPVDGEKRYFLVNGVERADDGTHDSQASPVVSPLSTVSETLFDPPPARSAYREAA